MESTTCKIVTIPKLDQSPDACEEKAVALAHKLREFRLHSLKTSPGAFAASYEDEVQRGLDHTFTRLTNPKATQFVALRGNEADSKAGVEEAQIDDLTTSEWYGFIGIFGPLEDSLGHVSAVTDPFAQMTSNSGNESASSAGSEQSDASYPLGFHLNGMFVSPAARGMGLAKRLIDAALDQAEREGSRNSSGVQCTILLDEWNKPAKNLYEQAGFRVIGRERYTQDTKRLAEGERASNERVALRMQVRRGGK